MPEGQFTFVQAGGGDKNLLANNFKEIRRKDDLSSSQNVTRKTGSWESLTNGQRQEGNSCHTSLVTFFGNDIFPIFLKLS
jgi:hypothetical protein